MFSDLDLYFFREGTHAELDRKLGAHPLRGRAEGYSFAVWAPHAKTVSVVGDFNGWTPGADRLLPLPKSGIFSGTVPNAQDGQYYRFLIETADGRLLEKSDPFAFCTELRPGSASRLFRSRFRFTDAAWRKARSTFEADSRPVSIYEVQLASFMRDPAKPTEFHGYRTLAKLLGDYVEKMGYTHVELIGIPEYPLDASWGYQVTGYFSPTARHGSPDDFKYFVNHLHRRGIGVILDWVPAHFPRNAEGLAEFDGEPLYEYAEPQRGDHPEWGTKVFHFGRGEVSSFLLSSAHRWLREYHIDGLRVDAVASMLYLDYGRKPGEWQPNPDGSRENREAEAFLKRLNTAVRRDFPGVMTIAEESTTWPGVTKPPSEGGLGFSLKWNMGWMHDFLDYQCSDPWFRQFRHNLMTFSMMYAFSERFVLVLSHDEVVHLKRSLWSKLPGDEAQKYAGLKAAYAFFIGHPGKKLLFMGQDFGQRREWSEERELDWFLLADERNRQLQHFFGDLLKLYRNEPALYGDHLGYNGFSWINCDDASRSIFSFCRTAPDGKLLIFAISFTPVPRPDYRIGLPRSGKYTLILTEKGAIPLKQQIPLSAEHRPCDGKEYSLAHPLPAYGVAVFSAESL